MYRPKRPATGRGPLLSATALGLTLVAMPVAAQTTPGVTQLPAVTVTETPASLTVPSVEQAREAINRTPGGVEIVPAEEYRDTRALGIKDMLDYVPGVLAQPKFGEDSRFSIRGAGLSRNFHLRGTLLLQDGVPINLADGSGDFQEIDPLAYRYTEVYKGANALRYGSLVPGGAVNFVTPTGRDWPLFQARAEGGSYDFRRFNMSTGVAHGKWDFFATPTFIDRTGFREHGNQSDQHFNSNIGYRIGDNAETRLYAAYHNIDQQIPGTVSRSQALNNPKAAAAGNILLNQKRDVESYRIVNKTTVRLDNGFQVEGGVYYNERQLDHPIFQVLDNHANDYGGFGRVTGEASVFGFRDTFQFGTTIRSGTNLDKRFVNVLGSKGAATYDSELSAFNADLYGENQLYVLQDFAIVTGLQLGYAKRSTEDRFLRDGDDMASRPYQYLSPKIGFIWDVDKNWQVYGNVSQSTEVPTLSELNPSATPGFADIDAQRATTVEVGTRGQRDRLGWDLSLYRTWIKDEIQIFDAGNGATQSLNADRTIHQGIELGFDVDVWRGLLESETGADKIWLRTAYTFSDFRFDNDRLYGNNELPGAPRHYIRAETLYKHPVGVFFGPNVEWVPEAYFVDNANTLKTRAYALLGARAGYDFGFGSVFIDGRNLTNEKYIATTSVTSQATANQALFNPGDGTTIYAGATFKW